MEATAAVSRFDQEVYVCRYLRGFAYVVGCGESEGIDVGCAGCLVLLRTCKVHTYVNDCKPS